MPVQYKEYLCTPRVRPIARLISNRCCRGCWPTASSRQHTPTRPWKRYRAAPNNGVHPLIFLAAQQFADLSRPGKTLTLETLTAWLALHYGQPYVRIDPLNIDVASVTGLMSFAFAQRHQILVIAADRDAITIASAQPDVGSWEADLRQVLKRPIKRVIANPLEIARLGSELYKLAKSVTGATLNDQKRTKRCPSNRRPI